VVSWAGVEATPPSSPDPRVGSLLQGRYRILSQLASGAMGVVYRGERVQLGRPVAVKFLHPWIAAQKAFLGRFENEARAMSRLSHPNCVSVIDFGVDGSPYLVMDFVTGQTLRHSLEAGRLPVSRALPIVRQILAGLAHAHAHGIVHRDLKPENLILSAEAGLEDHLQILDFGLAKLRDGPAMTAGLAVGTPSYMSPEQTGADGAIDARTDIYTVGVLLFEILTGRKPFQSQNVGELLLMHRETAPPLLRETSPESGYSAELEAVVSKALSKFGDQRFQSAAEFSAAIGATPEGRGVGPAVGARLPSVGTGVGAGVPRVPGAPSPADATIVDSPSAISRIPGVAAAKAEGTASDGAKDLAKDVTKSGVTKKGQRGLVWGGLGLAALAVAALLVGRALRSNEKSSAGTEAAAGPARGAETAETSKRAKSAGSKVVAAEPATPPPSAPAPADATGEPSLEQARQLAARGEWQPAVAELKRLRAAKPHDADAAYLLATIYFDHHHWSDGLTTAQIAVREDPALKADPDLIKGAIQSLVSDPTYERSQTFLRGLGAPSVPFVKEAAQHDPSAKVRDRAAALLGASRPSHGWATRSASSTPSRSAASRSSIFRR
jgi:hypothetical protein